jgi:hypothetical protein
MANPFLKLSTRIPVEWRDARGHAAAEIREATRMAADAVIRVFKRNVRLRGAVASRELVNAAASRVRRESGVRGWYTREVFLRRPAADYYRWVDQPRRAGKMPIEVWVDSEGRTRWRPFAHVANYLRIRGVPVERWWVAIRRMARGFRGHRFVAATVRESRPVVRAILEEAVERVKKRLTSRGRGARRR